MHTGPITRKEEIYRHMSIEERRRIFNKMVAFIRQINIRYRCFYIFCPSMMLKSTMTMARSKSAKYFPLFSMPCFQILYSAKLCLRNISFSKLPTCYVHWNWLNLNWKIICSPNRKNPSSGISVT